MFASLTAEQRPEWIFLKPKSINNFLSKYSKKVILCALTNKGNLRRYKTSSYIKPFLCNFFF